MRVCTLHRVFDDFDLYETFPVLREFRWTFQDDGRLNGPSAWAVESNRLRQTGSIGDADLLAARGALASTATKDWGRVPHVCAITVYENWSRWQQSFATPIASVFIGSR